MNKKLYTVKLETVMVVYAEDDAEAATLAWEAYDEGEVDVDFDTSVEPTKSMPQNVAWDLNSIPVGSDNTINDLIVERLSQLDRAIDAALLLQDKATGGDIQTLGADIRRMEKQAVDLIRMHTAAKSVKFHREMEYASAEAKRLLGR